ncbi:Mannose-1-phosphate guanylyltransferase (GDP) [Caldibacillus thermoamylovorans]|uniref:sugar phosphate nucleotidyltransferase n=1 Tax=Caldibacillus thermoamylovorans TaxID=35841 RepID=UPI0005A473D5|nr:sugar phosphate nucleotidyltransferase [Caldibacillus thermoamylovorans]KIO68307.1 Mannose-1-phosphate guanylyltransferase (GDP) [Caldibacillus thermoamylovorans]
MKLILLSGGSGKRLWPLSNDARSKQFLKVLENNGNLESMVQRVWGQLERVNLNESTLIATSKSQVDMIQSQLGSHIPLIIEPERRDTYPAIALAATYLYSTKGVSLKETVVVLPVDPFVDTAFFERIKDFEKALNTSDAELALMGVKPTYPSEKYGYLVPEEQNTINDYFHISYFKEKPSYAEAKELIDNDALWNCGVFAFKLEYIISLLQSQGLPIQYDELLKQYNTLEKISFDYAVVEKAEKIVALPYEGYWKDLGTWNTLTEEMSTRQLGKGIISDDSNNTHLVNELDIPVVVLGIEGAVIAASPDGILVTDKDASPRIKEVLKGYGNRPMYEERRWGWYKVLDHTKFEEGNEVLTKRIGVKAGKNLSYQKHFARSEVWTIIRGEGEFAFNDEIRKVKAGDILEIPIEAKHGIKAITDLEFIEVQTGTELIEEDIVRIYLEWDDVKKRCKSLINN